MNDLVIAKKYLMEVIGTFFLVFVIGMTSIDSGAGTSAPFAIGLTLLIMIILGGNISGGHYNPAVTIGFILSGKVNISRSIWYIFAQLLGAALAGFLVSYLKDYVEPDFVPAPVNKIFIVEIIYTFALVTAVLVTSVIKHSIGILVTAVSVGLVVATGGVTVGSISGAAFNPAVVLGNAVMGVYEWDMIWIIVGANVVASITASFFIYKVIGISELTLNSNSNSAENLLNARRIRKGGLAPTSKSQSGLSGRSGKDVIYIRRGT